MQSYLSGRSPDSTRDQVDSRDFPCYVINFMWGMDPLTCNTISAESVLVIALLRFLCNNLHDILHSFLYIFSDVIDDVNVWWIACSASEQVKT